MLFDIFSIVLWLKNILQEKVDQSENLQAAQLREN